MEEGEKAGGGKGKKEEWRTGRKRGQGGKEDRKEKKRGMKMNRAK